MSSHINLLKLSVGTETVAGLQAWQDQTRVETTDGYPRHITRMWPKREAEVIAGGSIFWVIKGVILCRQPIVRFDEIIGNDGIRRCAFVSEPGLIKVMPTPKRAFQGWRYLKAEDAPEDLPKGREDETPLPPDLTKALADIGVW
jgi:hypothetical protein